MPFLVGGTRQHLILTFNAITAMSKSETWCPARLTHQVSPCTPIHTPDTRGGKLRPLCCQLSSWKQGRMSCLLARPYASGRVARTHTAHTQVRLAAKEALMHLLRQHQPLLHGFGHLQEWYPHPTAPTYWGDFCGRSDKANLILMFSAIIGRSKSEARCPAQLTY